MGLLVGFWLLWGVATAEPALREAGVAALQAGQPTQARELLTQATANNPRDVAAWWELGWAHWMLQDYAAAIAAWEKVRQLDPRHPEVEEWLHTARSRQQLSGFSRSAAEVPLDAQGASVTIAAAGDTMMGSDLRKGERGLPPGDGSAIFADVAAYFKAVDLAFLNLEGTFADGLPSTKCAPDSTNCYAFRTPTRFARALPAAGIDVVSNANNHSMDLGPEGMDSTLAALDAAGVAHTSRYGDVAMLERKGLKIAVVGAHSGTCCLNVNRIAEIQAAIAQADQKADLVIFSFHGGAEGPGARHVPGRVEIAWGESRGDVRALSRAAIDAGADLVLGHGPHVLRAMEVYRGRLIAYSLGNFVGFRQFGTQGGHSGTSVILEVEVAANGVLRSARLHPMKLDGEGIPHPDPSAAALASIQELSDADFPQSGVKIAPDGRITWR